MNQIHPDGSADFRTNEIAKEMQCHRENLCILCGQKLGREAVLIGPPEDVEARIFYDGPSHEECLLYAVKACPFLANPDFVRTKRDPKFSEGAEIVRDFSPEEYLRPARLALVYVTEWHPVWREFRYFTETYQVLRVDWDTVPKRS